MIERKVSKYLKFIIPIFIATSLVGCTRVIVAEDGAKGEHAYHEKRDERPVSVMTSDAAITSEIKAKFLANRNIKVLNISVYTYDGVVTLSGKVRNATEKNTAINIAQDVSGVKSVISKLEIIR